MRAFQRNRLAYSALLLITIIGCIIITKLYSIAFHDPSAPNGALIALGLVIYGVILIFSLVYLNEIRASYKVKRLAWNIPSNITHVCQKWSDNNLIACIAMVTGNTLKTVDTEMFTEYGKGPYLDADYKAMLEKHSISFELVDNFPQAGKLYIAGMPDLNNPGRIHYVVLDLREHLARIPGRLFDPNNGSGPELKLITFKDWFNYTIDVAKLREIHEI